MLLYTVYALLRLYTTQRHTLSCNAGTIVFFTYLYAGTSQPNSMIFFSSTSPAVISLISATFFGEIL